MSRLLTCNVGRPIAVLLRTLQNVRCGNERCLGVKAFISTLYNYMVSLRFTNGRVEPDANESLRGGGSPAVPDRERRHSALCSALAECALAGREAKSQALFAHHNKDRSKSRSLCGIQAG